VRISDQDFLDTLRGAVDRYFAAVDKWEAAWRRYYRMPGVATPSADLEGEQREFEARRQELSEMLPRARSLCYKHGKADVFSGLPYTSLGERAPQLRADSAIGRGERGAVTACLIELSILCREADCGFTDGEKKPASLIDRIIGLFD
jgi:hypothetical protein